MSVKWIGFDMDECVGSVMPLFAFVSFLPPELVETFIVPIIAESELKRQTWLLRPGLLPALQTIRYAYLNNLITGCFLFSNNGSEKLVNSVCSILNTIMKCNAFRMGVCHGAAPRGQTDIKDFTGIQNSLAYHGLPPLCSPDDLLFFDDMKHALERETANYVQVTPYFYNTPVDKIIDVLVPVLHFIDEKLWKGICKKGIQFQRADFANKSNRYISSQQPIEGIQKDYEFFNDKIVKFLGITRK